MNSVPCSTFKSFTKSFVSWRLRNWIFPLGLNVNQIFELYQPQKNIKGASVSPWGSFRGPNPAWTPWRPSLGVLWAHSLPHCKLWVLHPRPCLLDALTWDHISCSVAVWPPLWFQVPWPLILPALLLGFILWVCCAFLSADSIWESPSVYVSYGALFFKKSFIEICQLYLREVKLLVTEWFKWKTK